MGENVQRRAVSMGHLVRRPLQRELETAERFRARRAPEAGPPAARGTREGPAKAHETGPATKQHTTVDQAATVHVTQERRTLMETCLSLGARCDRPGVGGAEAPLPAPPLRAADAAASCDCSSGCERCDRCTGTTTSILGRGLAAVGLDNGIKRQASKSTIDDDRTCRLVEPRRIFMY